MPALVFPAIAVTFLGLVWAWAVAAFPWARRHRAIVAAALGLLVLSVMATREVEVRWHALSSLHVVLVSAVAALILSGGPLAVVRAAGAIGARRRRALEARDPMPVAPAVTTGMAPEVTRRQLVEGAAGISVLATSAACIGWGVVRGRHDFRIEEIAVRIPGLPRTLDGYVIAQVSDLHVGDNVGEDMLDEGLARVREARPDLLVITGDVVDMHPSFAPLAARKLAALAPRDGAYACLGNHDHYTGADLVAETLRLAGVTPLVNDGRVIRAGDGGGFALLGVDDLRAERRRGRGVSLDAALAAVPADRPRILLSHQPWTVDRWAGQVALQLSGHTHGGQLNPGGVRVADLFLPYVAGRFEVGGTTLYVNRGFGTVGPPARLGAPPEITRIVLVAA